ncbi:unnamed protein product [Closterium sp. NIES-54]
MGSHGNTAATSARYHQSLHAAAATSTTAAAASTTAAAASTTPTAATEAPTPTTTPTSTATPSSSSAASTAAPTVPSTTLAPLVLAVAASPTRSSTAPTSAPTRSTVEAEATEGRRGTGEHPSKKGTQGSPREAPTATILFSPAVRRSSSMLTVSSVGQRERKWSLTKARESGR